jgi:hypothetical protein
MSQGNFKAPWIIVWVLALGLSAWASAPSLGADDWDNGSGTEASTGKAPLKGEVEESGVAPSKAGPVAPKEPLPQPVFRQPKAETGQSEEASVDNSEKDPLKATVDRSQLKGREEDDDADQGLKPMSGKSSPDGGALKGSAEREGSGLAGDDPDSQDQELQVEWDRWRNRLLRAVLAGAMENLNNPQAADFRWDPIRQRVMTQFPLGTIAWFACTVTSDRRIKTLRLMESSGYPNYDRAVLDAVRSLEGTSILKFPARSHRDHVSQTGGVKTSEQSQPQYFKFGDVEHVRVPSY